MKLTRRIFYSAIVTTCICSSFPAQATTYQGDTTGGPTWNRVFGSPASPSLSGTGTDVPYNILQISLTSPSQFSAEITSAGFGDTYLYLYQGNFDPTNQFQNLVALNDDGGTDALSLIDNTNSGPFDIGQYTLVVSGFENSDFGPYTAELLGAILLGWMSEANQEASLSSIQATSQMAVSLPSLTLNGVHHRPLIMQDTGATGHCMWMTGDYGKFTDNSADDSLFEVGGCQDLMSGTLRAGIGLGINQVNQDLGFSGNADIDGKYVLLELDYQAQNSPLIASLISYYGNYDADIKRGYFTFAGLDSSTGTSDVDVWAIRARLDYQSLWSFADISVTPYTSFTVSSSEFDDYTEKGGAFPASFNSRRITSEELRIGTSVEKSISERTKIWGMLEAVHSFAGEEDDLSGVVGGTTFSLANKGDDHTWGRIGAEIDYELQKNINISATLFASTEGRDPDYSSAISLKVGF